MEDKETRTPGIEADFSIIEVPKVAFKKLQRMALDFKKPNVDER